MSRYRVEVYQCRINNIEQWFWYMYSTAPESSSRGPDSGPFKIKALAWKDVHNTIGKAGNGTVTISPNSNPIP
jgi:hypothetical protein